MSSEVTYRVINGKKMAIVGAKKNKKGEYVGGTIIGPASNYEKEGMSLADQINFSNRSQGGMIKGFSPIARPQRFKGVF